MSGGRNVRFGDSTQLLKWPLDPAKAWLFSAGWKRRAPCFVFPGRTPKRMCFFLATKSVSHQLVGGLSIFIPVRIAFIHPNSCEIVSILTISSWIPRVTRRYRVGACQKSSMLEDGLRKHCGTNKFAVCHSIPELSLWYGSRRRS